MHCYCGVCLCVHFTLASENGCLLFIVYVAGYDLLLAYIYKGSSESFLPDTEMAPRVPIPMIFQVCSFRGPTENVEIAVIIRLIVVVRLGWHFSQQ